MGRPKATTISKSAISEQEGNVTKAYAVRAALARGYKMPAEGVPFIKTEFGIDMPRQQFSVYKSDFKKRGRKGGKVKRTLPAAGYLPGPRPKARAAGSPDALTAIEAIKPLIDQYGAERVKRIVDLLG